MSPRPADVLVIRSRLRASSRRPRRRWIAALAAGAVSGLGLALAVPLPARAATATVTFSYNGTDGTDGSAQTWTVPAGVTSASFDLFGAAGGASGGASFPHRAGGKGAHLHATIAVSGGEVLQILVGGAAPGNGNEAGGFNGGGSHSTAAGNVPVVSGGGGGASDVRRGPGYALADRVLIAGAGAGGGGDGIGTGPSGSGGAAGGPGGDSGGAGQPGTNAASDPPNTAMGGGGGGAGTTTGGTGGTVSGTSPGSPGGMGSPGQGGSGGGGGTFAGNGGGGGGGYFGGGGGGGGGTDFSLHLGGGGGGGGGGSSFSPTGATDVSLTEGDHAGNGSVVITYTLPALTITPASGPAGTFVKVRGSGFQTGESVHVKYRTSQLPPPQGPSTIFCTGLVQADGTFKCSGHIPTGAAAGALGPHDIVGKGLTSLIKARTTFTLTA